MCAEIRHGELQCQSTRKGNSLHCVNISGEAPGMEAVCTRGAAALWYQKLAANLNKTTGVPSTAMAHVEVAVFPQLLLGHALGEWTNRFVLDVLLRCRVHRPKSLDVGHILPISSPEALIAISRLRNGTILLGLDVVHDPHAFTQRPVVQGSFLSGALVCRREGVADAAGVGQLVDPFTRINVETWRVVMRRCHHLHLARRAQKVRRRLHGIERTALRRPSHAHDVTGRKGSLPSSREAILGGVQALALAVVVEERAHRRHSQSQPPLGGGCDALAEATATTTTTTATTTAKLRS